ncbi:MAG: rod shape-determining protein MreC [Solirubrobacteraceae bacterium]|nr:rod shape-determining protein MreC [Solirubrobacteraceae bacterium]
MYDKSVRRRRAVLALLVVSCLILLTAYFGNSAGGSIQRGFNEVLSPIQEGASRALKPARDLVGWFGDTLDAKGDVEDLRRERDDLRNELVANEAAARENQELRAQLEMTQALSLGDYGPKTARVIYYDPSVWYSSIGIDKGSSDGVRTGMPVIASGGLVGHVDDVTRGSARVTLITDHTSGVPARTNRGGATPVLGVVESSGAGNPNDLVLNYTPPRREVDEGERIITSGTNSSRFTSLYPPNLPIGEVTSIEDPGSDSQEIHLRPFVDLRGLEFVQVLTTVNSGNDGG